MTRILVTGVVLKFCTQLLGATQGAAAAKSPKYRPKFKELQRAITAIGIMLLDFRLGDLVEHLPTSSGGSQQKKLNLRLKTGDFLRVGYRRVKMTSVPCVFTAGALLCVCITPCSADIASGFSDVPNSAAVYSCEHLPKGGFVCHGAFAGPIVNPVGQASASSGTAFAQGVPGQNFSYLEAASAAPDMSAGTANVHYTLENKFTGQVDVHGGVKMDISGGTGGDNSYWAVSVGLDNPPPSLFFTADSAGNITKAFMTGGFGSEAYGYATGTVLATGSQFSSYKDDLSNGVVTGNNSSLDTSLIFITNGQIDVDEYVFAQGGAAAIDPVLTPLNPNDIIVSSAAIDPNPGGPIFTSSQIAFMTEQGWNLSGLQSVGLIGPTAVPEPRVIPLLAAGLYALSVLRRRYGSRAGVGPGLRSRGATALSILFLALHQRL
jgi:hypothetical protein